MAAKLVLCLRGARQKLASMWTIVNFIRAFDMIKQTMAQPKIQILLNMRTNYVQFEYLQ